MSYRGSALSVDDDDNYLISNREDIYNSEHGKLIRSLFENSKCLYSACAIEEDNK